MIGSQIKVSWRNLTKKKLQFTINLIGLTVSIVSAVVIALFLSHEYSFNTGFRNHESIYRVDQDYSAGDQNLYWATTPSALLPALHSQLPDLERGTIVFDISTFTTFLVDGGDGNREEKSIAFADTSFFEVFDIEFLVGSRQKVLHEPYNVVLSESMAKRYFKDSQHALGKVLKVNNRTEFTVAGVIPDFPSNSTLNYDFIGSFLSQPHGKDPSWSNNNYHTYLKLNPGSNPDQTSSLINEWIENEFGEDLKQNNVTTHFSLAPLSTIHFDTQREMYGSVAAMDERYLKLLGAIGLLLILVGAANFINLSTAESVEHAKEIGIRKIIGASRTSLFWKFFMESSLLTGISILSGVLILQLIFSPLSQYLNFKLDMAPVFSLKGVLFLVGLFLSISILAGVYPALFLSKIKPLKTISHTNSRSGVLFRRVLVVFQFFVSISLVLSTFIIQKQFSFMKQADLGFQKEELLVLPINARITEQVDSYVSELFRKNLIREASRAGDSPVLVKAQYSMSKNGDSENQIAVTGYSGDADLIPTLGLSLLTGNDFSDRDPFMSQVEENGEFPVLINKSGAEALGWEPGEAINKKFSFDGLNAYIKGVIEDFHFNSLHKEIGPLVIFLEPNYSSKLLLRITGSNVSLTLQELKSSWNQLIPDRPFSFEFVDQQYQLMYDSEQRLGRIFTLFSTVSIVLSALGLLGLISFLAHQKTKEISIRRVLGAEFAEILKFLAYDFLVLLGFSSLGAVLFGIWFSSSWLQGFAYKTSIPPLIFALAILTVFLVSLSVISLRIWRIFHQKPIETLNK